MANRIFKTADEIMTRHLAPRLKDAGKRLNNNAIGPEHVAFAATALEKGVWKERDVKRYFDKKLGG